MTPKRKRFYSSPSAFIISFSQIAASRLLGLYIRLFNRYDASLAIDFEPDQTYLILSNHARKLDPFAIFAAHSFVSNIKVAPVRFLTSKKEYYSPLFLWLKSMGCYPTKNRKLTVPETVNLLKSGYSVVLFPEGKLVKNRDNSQPKDGTKLILEQLRKEDINVKIILVHLTWSPKNSFEHVTIRTTEASSDIYKKSVKEIMDDIYTV